MTFPFLSLPGRSVSLVDLLESSSPTVLSRREMFGSPVRVGRTGKVSEVYARDRALS